MKKLIEDFSAHLTEAMRIAAEIKVGAGKKDFQNIVITGLGGSGIGGKIVSQLVASSCPLPIYINNDYSLPAFISAKTLVIASSYSGNTEETLFSVEQALEAGAEVFCISSGGKLIELAKSKNLSFVQIPGGFPPRAAFGYSFPQLFYALAAYGLIPAGFAEDLKEAIDLLEKNEDNIRKEARDVAEKLYGKIPVIYSEARFEGVAVRFRQQINENSKMLCWHHVLPEMNHNELVGWAGGSEKFAVVLLTNETDFYRTKERFKFSRSIFAQHQPVIVEIASKGNSNTARALYLIHLTDWTSLFLAELKGIDPVEVDVITSLKSRLAEID